MRSQDMAEKEFGYRVWKDCHQHSFTITKELITQIGRKYVYCGRRRYCQPENNPNSNYLEIPLSERIADCDLLFADKDKAIDFVAITDMRAEITEKFRYHANQIDDNDIKQIYKIMKKYFK